jgi:hypothetical protein
MNRQLYQTGGNTLPIYPRIEAIETSLGGAEKRIGDPALGQSSNSPLSNVYNNEISGTGIGSIFGNTDGQQPNPIQPGSAVDPIGFPQQPGMPQPIQPGPSVDPIKPLGPRGPRPFGPQVDPNRDYGFNQYGFDSSLLNYLNQQKQGSFIDAGTSYNYDPTTQTFSGGNMMSQYGNIPLSVLQQVATSGDRNLLQQYQTGGRNFNQPSGNIFGIMSQRQQAPMQQFSYGGRAGYQEGGIGMMQDQTMYNPLQSNYYNGRPMMMAGGGITNLVEREKYGIGSKLKKFVRKLIPNEISSIAVKAAPFVAPFNPALAAAMAGFGGFDQTGRIGSSLKSAALTYGGGQLARGIGGAGFQGNPFTGVDFTGGFTSGIGSLFSSPMGTQPFGSFSTPITPTQSNFIGTDALTYDPTTGQQLGRSAQELQSTLSGTQPGYMELIKKAGSFENVPLSERFNAVKDLSTKALKDIYTKPIINPKTGETTYALDKNALFSTFAGASSYYEALQLAKKAGVSEGEFSEADYQRLKIDPKKKQYQEVLKPESFGIRPTAAGGGLMNEGVLSIKLTPAQAMARGGKINYPMGSEIPVRQNQGGVSELDLRAKGGYIPVGIKEKADDVPAMLSRNEFVFTADAVRGAGNGSINKGAQKMYKLMKSLEKKVKKMKKVA